MLSNSTKKKISIALLSTGMLFGTNMIPITAHAETLNSKQIEGQQLNKVENQSKNTDSTVNKKVENQSKNTDSTINKKVENQSKNTDSTINKKVENQSKNTDSTINKNVENQSKNTDSTINKNIENQSKNTDSTINKPMDIIKNPSQLIAGQFATVTNSIAQTSSDMGFLTWPGGSAFVVPVVTNESTGQLAYCENHNLPNPGWYAHDNYYYNLGGVNYSLLNNSMQNQIAWIVESNPNMSGADGFSSQDVDYYVKQSAIAHILGVGLRNLQYCNPSIYKTAIENLVNESYQHTNYYQTLIPTINVNTNNHNMSYDSQNNTYVSDWINLQVPNNVSHMQYQTYNFPNGTKYQLQNGQIVNNLPTSTSTFKVIMPANEINHNYDNLTMGWQGTFLINAPIVYTPYQSGLQHFMSPGKMEVEQSHMNFLTLDLTMPKGNIEVVKTGNNGQKLAGAEFELIQNGKVVETQYTNSQGIANFNNLDNGNYQVKEEKAPNGYNLNDTTYNETVNTGKTDIVNVKDNETTGLFQIEKTNITNGKEVAGAKIQITGTSLTGQKINITFTSGTTPKVFTLPAGSYQYKEIDSPAGYNENSTVGHFTIDKQGQIVKADIKDTPTTGKLEIEKTNITNGKEVAGAKIQITGTSLT
uniref:MSCRAMM family protein n=1 Tax=Clostridium thermobutyricum TaxID=29372 RepID=UPI002942A76B